MYSPSDPPILELKNASYSYPGVASFISDLSFSIGEGEFIGLLGANGSGKSTILKICCGIVRPHTGTVQLWAKDIHAYRNRDRAKLISYLPQSLDIHVPFTVRQLVAMGLYPYDIPPALTVDEALRLVGLEDRADSFLTDLSGGERRRTFIAMTLVQGAGLLLLDEPLANLDIRYQIELIRLLEKLREDRRISVIMALHDVTVAVHFEKVMLIRGGNIIGMGSPESVLTRELLRDAFEVDIAVRKEGRHGAHISFGNGF